MLSTLRMPIERHAVSIFGGVSRQVGDSLCQKLPLGDVRKIVSFGGTTIHAEFGSCATYFEEGISITILGYLVPQGGELCLSPDEFASSVLRSYRQDGNLAAAEFDGSYTLIVCDHAAGQVTVFRNLGDTHHIYYSESSHGCFFSDNPLVLARRAGLELRPNDDMLPIYFLYRSVPGRETLYRGLRRLLPGEQMTCSSRGLYIRQMATLGSLTQKGQATTSNAVDQVDHAFGYVISDYARLDPQASVLLSGGVDSSYIQAHWNRVIGDSSHSISYAIATNHTVGQQERQYAHVAAQLLGTDHRDVPTQGPYAAYLVAAIAVSGEPPNHVQTPYFLHLADAMCGDGVVTGLCGQGADAIFGSPWGDGIYRASWVNRIFPLRGIQSLLLRSAQILGKVYWADAIRLAEHVDDLSWPDHPVNRHDTFGDGKAVERCFGRNSLVEACQHRLADLDRQEIAPDVLRRVNEIGLLGDTYDTCSLWSTLFRASGVRLLFPFLDTRVLRAAMQLSSSDRFPYRSPKRVIKQALCRYMPASFVNQKKLSFAQPIYSWLSPDGELRPLVDQIDEYDFVDKGLLAEAKAKPNSFLYCLLCYDLWHKLCIRNINQEDLVNAS